MTAYNVTIPPPSEHHNDGPAPADSQTQLRQLYEQHADVVFRYAASRCGREAAGDILADTFVEAARSLGSFDASRGSEQSWLLGITTRRIGRYRRQEARHFRQRAHADVNLDALGELSAELDSLPGRIDATRMADAAMHAVANLPKAERAAFLLHAVAGLNTTGVADALGIELSAAKVRVHRARTRLRAALAPLMTTEVAQ